MATVGATPLAIVGSHTCCLLPAAACCFFYKLNGDEREILQEASRRLLWPANCLKFKAGRAPKPLRA